MPDSEKGRSEGTITKIVIGVATPVLTALLLYWLGVGGEKKNPSNPVPQQVQNVQPANDADIRAKQEELERRIQELSANKRTEIQQGIAEIQTRREQAQETTAEPAAVDFRGTWYAPSTGSAYVIQQDGNLITFQEYTAQIVTGYAQGTLQGRRANFEFYSTTLGVRVNGFIEVSEDNRVAITVINPINGMRTTSDLQRSE